MRKINLAAPFPVLFAGIAGMIYKRRELVEIYDAVTGLPDKTSMLPKTVLLLFEAVLTFSVVFAFLGTLGLTAEKKYSKAFKIKSVVTALLSMLMGIALSGLAILMYFENVYVYPRVLNIIFTVFAVLSGISVIFITRSTFTTKNEAGLALWSIIPTLFYCFWMAMTYRENAQCPIIIKYCYVCMALAATALSFYFAAGFVFSHRNVKMTVISHFLAIFLLPVAISCVAGFYARLYLGLTVAVLFLQILRFIANLKKDKEETEE